MALGATAFLHLTVVIFTHFQRSRICITHCRIARDTKSMDTYWGGGGGGATSGITDWGVAWRMNSFMGFACNCRVEFSFREPELWAIVFTY